MPVNLSNLLLNPTQLQQYQDLRPDMMPLFWQWRDNARRGDSLSLENATRALAHAKAMDPLLLQTAGANLESIYANTEGTRASTENTRARTSSIPLENRLKEEQRRGLQLENDHGESIIPEKKKSAVAKFLREASDADFAKAENDVYNLIRSNNSKQRKAGMELLPYLKSSVEGRYKTDSQLRVVGATQAGQQSLEALRHKNAMELQAQKDASSTERSRIAAEARLKASSANSKQSWQNLAVEFAQKAIATTDPNIKADLEGYAQYAQQMAERLQPAKPVITPEASGGMLQSPQGAAMPTLPANSATATRKDRMENPKTPQEAQAAGWKLMQDANGNKAYVGPNNQIMEIK